MSEIKFYSPKDPYYWLSNYYMSPMTLGNITFTCNEAFYQAMKFRNPDDERSMGYYSLIAQCDSPQKCKDMGSQKKSRYGSSWLINKAKPQLGYVSEAIDAYKDIKMFKNWDDVMIMGLYIKFKQNDKLRSLLLDTEDALLVENSPRDAYWGIGKDGKGKNMLGEDLMFIRSKFRDIKNLKAKFKLEVKDDQLKVSSTFY